MSRGRTVREEPLMMERETTVGPEGDCAQRAADAPAKLISADGH
jgi:hypothetical protein